jgi:hypothetical protein
MRFCTDTPEFYLFRADRDDPGYLNVLGGKATSQLRDAIKQSGISQIVINRWADENLDFLFDYRDQLRLLVIHDPTINPIPKGWSPQGPGDAPPDKLILPSGKLMVHKIGAEPSPTT